MTGFVHLHNHSDFSLLDGAGKVKEMVEMVAEGGAPGFGISDHGTTAGFVDLFKEAGKAGITPVPGVELYQADDRHLRRKTARGKQTYHLPTWAVSNTGLSNLIKLSSQAWEHKFHGKPRMDNELLGQYAEGLVITSGCLGSAVNQSLLHGDYDSALAQARLHQDMVGSDNYFIELQNHRIAEQNQVNEDLLRIGRSIGAPLLATNDVHYVRYEDHKMHDALLCCQVGKTLADEDRFKFVSPDQHYLKSSQEMLDLFPEEDFPGACSNTLLIAERAQGIDFGYGTREYLLPDFELPEGFDCADDYLHHLTQVGLRERYGDAAGDAVYQDRAEYELGVIRRMGFPSYFLIVADYIGWARDNGVLVGAGRGSAAGSLVAYATKITNIDPIKHDLLFERFLNPDRISMPDIDTDFDPEGRRAVVGYLVEKYGEDRVAHISSWVGYGGREAIRDAARVLGATSPQQTYLALGYPGDEMPQSVSAPPMAELLDPNAEFDADTEDVAQKYFQPLIARHDYRPDPDGSGDSRPTDKQYLGMKPEFVRSVYELASQFEYKTKSRGTHACGFIISPDAVTEHFPLATTKEGSAAILGHTTEYDAVALESVGGIKFDLLGLTNLEIVRRTVELVRNDLGIEVDPDNLALDDRKTYELLSRGDTSGVFQLESDGMKELLVQLRPREFSDIVAALALYRPGPMGSGFHTEFAHRRNGLSALSAPHEEMLELLADTAGLPIYQESIMQIARHFAGYTPGEADSFRKAIGKKQMEVLEENRERFVAGVKERYSERLGRELWGIIEPFAGYAFCRAHAAAYAMLSYSTAYLKAHYPAHFIAACIDTMKPERVPAQADDARRMGIEVFAPDVNKSEHLTTVSGGGIYLGFSTVRANQKTAGLIGNARDDGPFKSLGDFIARTKVQKDRVQNLIAAGGLDSLHGSRKAMFDAVADVIKEARNPKAAPNRMGLFAGVAEMDRTNYRTFEGEDWPPADRLAREHHAVGFVIGEHPYEILVAPHFNQMRARGVLPKDARPVGASSVIPDGTRVRLVGVLTGLENKTSRNGREFAILSVESGNLPEDQIECLMFGRHIPDDMLMQPVVVEGRLQTEVDGDDETRKVMGNEVRQIGDEAADFASETDAQRKINERGDFKPDNEVQKHQDVIFTITDMESAKQINSMVRRRDAGAKRIFVKYAGREHPIGKDGWDLTHDEARQIARQVPGVEMNWRQKGSRA